MLIVDHHFLDFWTVSFEPLDSAGARARSIEKLGAPNGFGRRSFGPGTAH